jgi:hypothetical protein
MHWHENTVLDDPVSITIVGTLELLAQCIREYCNEKSWNINVCYWQRKIVSFNLILLDRLCVLVVRVPDCQPTGPGFDSWHDQIFWVAVSLERGPLKPCEGKWGATWKKSSGCGLENWG